jgi:hypothetical protein
VIDNELCEMEHQHKLSRSSAAGVYDFRFYVYATELICSDEGKFCEPSYSVEKRQVKLFVSAFSVNQKGNNMSLFGKLGVL